MLYRVGDRRHRHHDHHHHHHHHRGLISNFFGEKVLNLEHSWGSNKPAPSDIETPFIICCTRVLTWELRPTSTSSIKKRLLPPPNFNHFYPFFINQSTKTSNLSKKKLATKNYAHHLPNSITVARWFPAHRSDQRYGPGGSDGIGAAPC